MTIVSESKSPLIHPTAIIDPVAEIDPTVQIGPNVIIEGPVRIQAGTSIMANAFICGNTIIGRENTIHIGCVIGHLPQHLHFKPSPELGVRIGDRNVFREYVTIHMSSNPTTITTVGDENFLMANSHVAHDASVGSNVVIANGSLLAGHSMVEDRAVLSGLVAVHQHARIGRLAMVGGCSKIVKDVPPYMTADGSAICGINTIGLRRAGYNQEQREKIKQAYKLIYRAGLSVPNAVTQLEERYPECAEVQHIVAFIKSSIRGISRQTRESAGE